jgi:hypothetical protein
MVIRWLLLISRIQATWAREYMLQRGFSTAVMLYDKSSQDFCSRSQNAKCFATQAVWYGI